MKSSWYDISITAIQREIKVKIELHNPNNDPDGTLMGPKDDEMKVSMTVLDGTYS